MPIVPVADFAPDQAPYMNVNSPIAKNTAPRADGADGPLKGQLELSDALAAQCRGGFTARDKNATAYMVAGTQTKLYVQSSLSWTDKSGITYAVPTGGHWHFTQFGEQIIGTNYFDPIQTWTMGGAGNFADLSASAPKAKYIATIEPGFCMVGFYDGGSVTPNGVWWSAINDATSWPTVGTLSATSVQSDNQELPGGGFITGILPAIGGANGVIFTERALYRVEYAGPPVIFAFREIDRSRGCVASNSLAQVGPVAFFLSEDGFCAFDGTSVTQIGQGKVDRFFWAEVDSTQLERVYATVDYDRKLVIWAYPTSSASNPNRWLIYSYSTNRWRYGDDAALTVEYMMPARTAGYTLDTLDTPLPGGPDGSGGFTVDSTLYTGGRRVLAAFNTSHKLVSFEGSNLAARIETGDANADGRRIFVSGIRPLTDLAAPAAFVGYRDTLDTAVSYGAATTPGVDAVCPQRIDTRYARACVSISSSTTWTYYQGADVIFRPSGWR